VNTYGKLAYTGGPTLVIGSFVINEWGLMAIALGLVALGAMLIRITWRHRKSVSDQ